MKSLNFCHRVLGVGIAAVILAACGGNPAAAPQLPATSGDVASASVAHGAHRVSPDGIAYTPTDVVIENSNYKLHLANRRTTDFVLSESNTKGWAQFCGNYGLGRLALKTGQSANGVEVASGSAARLVSGSPIGQAQSFSNGKWLMQLEYHSWVWWIWAHYHVCHRASSQQGNWPPKSRGYLALAFVMRGKIHYGWAAITVSPRQGNTAWFSATLRGYAYQTIAGKSINAGQM